MATADSPTTTQSKVQQQQQQQPVQDNQTDDQHNNQSKNNSQQQLQIHRPSANAGPDRKINEGANVALDSKSFF